MNENETAATVPGEPPPALSTGTLSQRPDVAHWRELFPAATRSALRWAGHEQLALDLDRLCDEDSP